MAFLAQLGRSRTMLGGYNFTEHVRKLLAMAREEAARLHHEYVGTEHILLGLLRQREGVGVAVLQNLGVDLDAVARTIDETVKPGPAGQRTGPDLPYTSRAKKVLELAMSEARELNHSYVGTEHLLLGLLREEKGIAAQVLLSAGVTHAAAHAETLRLVAPGAASPPTEPATSLHASPAARHPDRDVEEIAWQRLQHALDVCQRLGTTPTLSHVRDELGNRLTVSFGPDLTLTVEFPSDVHFGVRPRQQPPNG